MFTRFMDMHSGGGAKEPPYEYIYIEADETEAETIFQNRFGHDPHNVACNCCGNNYDVTCEETLDLVSAYDRGCKWVGKGYDISTGKVDVANYAARKDVLVICQHEIKDKERIE